MKPLPSTSSQVMGEIILRSRRAQTIERNREILRLTHEIEGLRIRQQTLEVKLKKEQGDSTTRGRNRVWLAAQLQVYTSLCQDRFSSIIAHSPQDVTALTKPVRIKFENRTYDLGKYKIQLRGGELHGTGRILITRPEGKTLKRDDSYIHPSISAGGNICWGNREKAIKALVRRKSYVEALLMLDTWLHTYGESPFMSIKHWGARKR